MISIQQYTYQADWSKVTTAFLNKYPNGQQPHVIEVDTISRQLTKEGHLQLRRLLRTKYLFLDYYYIEDIYINPNDKECLITTKPLHYQNLSIIEKCRYKGNKETTEYTQSIRLEHSILKNKIIQQYKEMSKKGIEVIENKIREIKK